MGKRESKVKVETIIDKGERKEIYQTRSGDLYTSRGEAEWWDYLKGDLQYNRFEPRLPGVDVMTYPSLEALVDYLEEDYAHLSEELEVVVNDGIMCIEDLVYPVRLVLGEVDRSGHKLTIEIKTLEKYKEEVLKMLEVM